MVVISSNLKKINSYLVARHCEKFEQPDVEGPRAYYSFLEGKECLVIAIIVSIEPPLSFLGTCRMKRTCLTYRR